MTTEVASPFGTGGGGPFFEAKVQASFLLHLLIGGRVPCLPSGTVRSIRFQGKQAGYATDGYGVRYGGVRYVRYGVSDMVSDMGVRYGIWGQA